MPIVFCLTYCLHFMVADEIPEPCEMRLPPAHRRSSAEIADRREAAVNRAKAVAAGKARHTFDDAEGGMEVLRRRRPREGRMGIMGNN